MTTSERQVGVSDGNVVLDLFVLQQRIAELMELALDGTDVRPAEYAVYSQLGIAPMTPRDLGARLGVTPSTMTGHLAALARRGHVRKVAQAEDRRSYRVELTASGRRTLEICRTGFRAMLARLETGLPVPASEVRAVLAGVERTAAGVAADLRAEVRRPQAAARPGR
ncbi:MarR family transcriptional regulator [Nocardioides sp. MAH-18]|uniref:MarR family transcriptional regulator n=1 Tax=Nocardioides agri TaxID=2682843 RepID=A0A6L6XVE1_9ACTN|nr:MULTISPECIES: MarR family transcriptional regulator [unclassified Nocardioides]MBA2956327.1 MarR family transcriptional regulator [Nocardioides sp. CGMCC 1.13656]MVQ51170.1 MarR family transcriptional regulator [Nocardioides sp. MAH-18]